MAGVIPLTYTCILISFNNDFGYSDRYGDFPAAQDMYDKCLSKRGEILGFDHLECAESYMDLGRTLFSRGLYDESTDRYLNALHIRESLLGVNHLDTARTYFHIGRLLQEMGDINGALTRMQKCREIQERVLGEYDRETAVTCSYIGLLLGETVTDGAYEQVLQPAQQGLQLAQSARRILEDILEADVGPGHPDTAFSLYVIAVCLKDSNVNEALSMAVRCRMDQTKALGNKHSSLARTHMLLGELFRLKGRHDESKECFEQALEIHESTHPDNHIIIARTCAHLSVAAFSLGQNKEAREMHGKVLSSLRNSGGTLNQPLVLIYTGAGEEYFNGQDYDAAVILFRQGLDVMVAMIGSHHPDLIQGYDAIGLALYNKGDPAGALQEYRRSLALKKEYWREDEVAQATSFINRMTTQWVAQRQDLHPYEQ